ncbi:MAG: O-acetylhomoserine aminocarboxypropyltransferase/cysteine synthase [Bifidobacterium pseudolongum]|nr:O-acetylhomoserine aminocarboxypropyltransferase/cysteine synthase [Bifidobacterium pseudolongum]
MAALAELAHRHGVPHVRRVQYSGLALEDEADSGSQARRVRRLFAHGVGPVLSFELDGGREQVSRVLDGVRVFSYVPNIGDARSLIVDPARITPREVPAEFREAAGVSDNLIRLSVGLEHVDDLIADLDKAIADAYA